MIFFCPDSIGMESIRQASETARLAESQSEQLKQAHQDTNTQSSLIQQMQTALSEQEEEANRMRIQIAELGKKLQS